MTRSLMSMMIKASTLGKTFMVFSEGETLYMGKNPRDAFQIIRDMEEVNISLLSENGNPVDWALLTPGETDAYICDCFCGGFFDNWEI
jgi:hypothetical protein